MKKILGLDLGSTSIGWAFVHEAENENEKTELKGAGVRVVSLTTDEVNNFSKGQAITTNADRTLKRGARRNLQRYKLRRYLLLKKLEEKGLITKDFVYAEQGLSSTHSAWELRARSAHQEVSLEDFCRVLLMINKKRGYKSSRKASSSDGLELGSSIDNVDLALTLQQRGETPGQYGYNALKNAGSDKFILPDFYASDLMLELQKIILKQREYYPELDQEFFDFFSSKNSKSQCSKYAQTTRGLKMAETPKSRLDKRDLFYKTRNDAVNNKVDLGEFLWTICELKGEIDGSSGYLGAISDRSKVLRVNNLTIGEYTFNKIKDNKQFSTKNIIFYRQDYVDEFNVVWDKQSEFHKILCDQDFKNEIRDLIIFYQRRLKSQKHLISNCEFAEQVSIPNPSNKNEKIPLKKKVIPKSSPLFQEFRVLQNLNNLRITEVNNETEMTFGIVEGEKDNEIRQRLLGWLNLKDKLTKKEIFQIIGLKDNGDYRLNFEEIQGNRTRASFIECFQTIFELTGHEKIEFNFKLNPQKFEDDLKLMLTSLGMPEEILEFNPLLEGNSFDKQLYYQVWHLLYSAEEDSHIKEELMQLMSIPKEWLPYFYKIKLEADYGSISAWAIRKLMPYLIKGETIDVAAEMHSQANPKFAFKHSRSLTKEELDSRELLDLLPLFKMGSLRNPVVEKVMNQLVNVVNSIIEDEEFGRPDEVRIEMARDLKASNDERDTITKSIASNQKRNEMLLDLLKKEFPELRDKRITKNDVLRYRLWLECNKTSIYTGNPIPLSKLFSNEIDIEHILPKSRIFNDSFANKTLCERKINEAKGNDTAMSYMLKQSPEVKNAFIQRAEELLKLGYQKGIEGISKTKFNNLMLTNEKIPDDFISRQLQETRYITKKATEHLQLVTRRVLHTTGIVTQKLREDWGLVDVLKELNWEKYSQIEGATYYEEGKNGERLKRIKDWTKRNDHRHHAMDAITVAFTKQAHIQYLNTLNSRAVNESRLNSMFDKILDQDQKSRFKAPIDNIRGQVRKVLEGIIISHKAKNKVTTPNINRIKLGGGKIAKVTENQETPRGQLHKETVYGQSLEYVTRFIKIGASTSLYELKAISNKKAREVVLARLNEYNGDIEKAFGGKNSLKKNPIYLDSAKTILLPEKVKITEMQERFTIRKDINKDLKIENVIDPQIRRLLKNRLDQFEGKSQLAFADLESNPIWLNEEKGIAIRKVKIGGVSNAIALHRKKDHLGQLVLDENGMTIPTDFVSTGNNHHVAIYRDENGNLQEEVVSLFEAVQRKKSGFPIINKNHSQGWEFVFSLRQNELFVFPNSDFNTMEMDYLNPENYSVISKHCFRVQKYTTKDYFFRHHLETQINTDIKNVTFKRINRLDLFNGVIKVRINHLGKIVDSHIQE